MPDESVTPPFRFTVVSATKCEHNKVPYTRGPNVPEAPKCPLPAVNWCPECELHFCPGHSGAHGHTGDPAKTVAEMRSEMEAAKTALGAAVQQTAAVQGQLVEANAKLSAAETKIADLQAKIAGLEAILSQPPAPPPPQPADPQPETPVPADPVTEPTPAEAVPEPSK